MESEPLAKACELAFAVARQGVEANPPIEPPVAMRSFLYVPQLPRRAMTVAQRVVDEDPEFRARVAAQASEGNVGHDGYLWLHRPSGWDSEPSFGRSAVTELVTGQSVAPEATGLPDLSKHAGESVFEPAAGTPAPSHHAAAPPSAPDAPVPPPAPPAGPVAATGAIPPPPPPPPSSAPDAVSAASTETAASSEAKASIEEELASLRGLVSRLAEERQSAATPVAGLETEIEERRAESNALATQLTSANTALQKVRDERNRAMSDREEMLNRQAELEAELAGLRTEVEQSRSAIAGVEAERTNTLTTLEQAQAELEDAQRRIETRVEAEAALRTQLDAAVTERDAAWRDASSLRVERDQLSDRVRVAEQARVDLESQLDDVSGQWQELKVEIQTLADERRAVETALDELSQTRETSAAERRLLFNDLASQLGQVEAERDHLASQIDLMRARITGTRSALDMATHSLTGELESADSAATASVAAVESLDSSLGLVHERLSTLGSAIDTDAVTTQAAPAAFVDAADAPVDQSPSFTPPQPPVPPMPGTASGDVGIEGFLPDGVVVESPPGRPEATLFGNPRDVTETHLFGDPVPTDDLADADADPDDDADDMISSESVTSFYDGSVERDTSFGGVSYGNVTSFGEMDENDDETSIVEADLVDTEPVDNDPVDNDLVDSDVVDAEMVGADDEVEHEVDDHGTASPLEGRSSADDDQALATVMASYGFGADDDDNVGDDNVDEGLTQLVDEPSFDMSDTSSFVDDDAASYSSQSVDDTPAPNAPDDTEARRIASTPDMVMLIDGDAAATMGWRDSAVADRRRYLLEKLDQVTGEYGPAVDVIFDPAVGGEDQMPVPTKVRRRLIQQGTSPGQKLSELVDSYPSHFPIAVVSDQEDLKAEMRLRSVDTLEVVQLLDLIVNLPEVD